MIIKTKEEVEQFLKDKNFKTQDELRKYIESDSFKLSDFILLDTDRDRYVFQYLWDKWQKEKESKQTLQIDIPQGQEFDEENSIIKFKPIKPKLAQSWEEYLDINDSAEVYFNDEVFKHFEGLPNHYKALRKLELLKAHYNGGWVAEWNILLNKWGISLGNYSNGIIYCNRAHFLSFKDKETAELFLKNFESIINEAKPLFT